MNHPYEIEINFSNVCGAECVICSRPHGCGNKFFMDWNVFNTLVEQLKGIQFKMIQTSGNGEAFLNPHYLDFIAVLKETFPKIPRWTYNNFSMMTRERTDVIIEEHLFDKVHVRIDSLVKEVFEKNSNLNQDIVFANLKYFLSKNKKIPVVILYNDIKKYYEKCQRVLGKPPTRNFFSAGELDKVENEEDKIFEYFNKISSSPLSIFSIGHSLWGERKQAKQDTKTPCPKWNVINSVTWVCPNGDVNVCCYDDTQSIFTCGNIMEEHLLSIYNGKRRSDILESIRTRSWIKYPCTSPKCCSMSDKDFEIERKNI